MSIIGQAGRRAKQFGAAHQNRHHIRYEGANQAPLIRRAPQRSEPVSTSNTNASAMPEVSATLPTIPTDSLVQRAPQDTADVSNADISVDRMGRITEQSREGEEGNSAQDPQGTAGINPEVIADRVYELMLQESRHHNDRHGKFRRL